MKLSNLTTVYTTSAQWDELAAGSRKVYRTGITTLDPLMDVDVNELTRPMIMEFVDSIWHKRATCRIAIQALNNILGYGYDRGLCNFNHARSIKKQPKALPIKKWTDEECGLFLSTAPTYLRRAFLMALYTGQRRSDLIRMKWEQYDGHSIKVIQMKTKRILYIPVHPQLKAELDAMKKESVLIQMGRKKSVPSPYILHNHIRQPFSALGMTAAVTRHAKSIGIVDRSIHGLRKTAGSTLAEIGCSPHLIGAILGHTTLKELMRYTEEADQKRMAIEAMEKWASSSTSHAAL